MPSSDLAPRVDRRCATCILWNQSDRYSDVGLCALAGTKAFRETSAGSVLFANEATFGWEGDDCKRWRRA